MIFKDELPVILIFIVVMAAIILTSFFIKQTKISKTKVEFEKSDSEIVTVWLDQGGKVVKSDRDINFWSEQIVINPQNLIVGGEMIIYNLATDVVDRNKFLILKVEKED